MPEIRRSRRHGRRIETLVTISPRALSPNKGHRLSTEEDAFILEKIAKGLTDIEVQRMFFRRFNRDITVSAVSHRRRNAD